MTIIAIDPGASGGIAAFGGFAPICWPMPDTEGDVLNLLRLAVRMAEAAGNPVAAYVEAQVGVLGPGFRVSSSAMFTFGRGYGFILGVLQALKVPIVLVRPQKWQKALALGSKTAAGGKGPWKNKLKAEAQRLFPKINVTLATADALLLLTYAHRAQSQ